MLMGTLDGGESELETTASPPPLILPEEKHAKQRRIEELKQGIANDPIDLYDEEFEKRVEDEILMIGNISLEMVQVSVSWFNVFFCLKFIEEVEFFSLCVKQCTVINILKNFEGIQYVICDLFFAPVFSSSFLD